MNLDELVEAIKSISPNARIYHVDYDGNESEISGEED